MNYIGGKDNKYIQVYYGRDDEEMRKQKSNQAISIHDLIRGVHPGDVIYCDFIEEESYHDEEVLVSDLPTVFEALFYRCL